MDVSVLGKEREVRPPSESNAFSPMDLMPSSMISVWIVLPMSPKSTPSTIPVPETVSTPVVRSSV